MKSFLLVTIFYFVSVSPAESQEKLSESEKAMQQTVTKVFAALSNRDSLALKEYCTSDILLVEYGQIWNLDSLILKAIKRNTAKDFKRVNNLEFVKTAVDKNMAWATYNLHSEVMREGKQSVIHWIETVVLVRKGKKWKLKALHSTMITRS